MILMIVVLVILACHNASFLAAMKEDAKELSPAPEKVEACMCVVASE